MHNFDRENILPHQFPNYSLKNAFKYFYYSQWIYSLFCPSLFFSSFMPPTRSQGNGTKSRPSLSLLMHIPPPPFSSIFLHFFFDFLIQNSSKIFKFLFRIMENEEKENNDMKDAFMVELILWAKGLANLDKFSKSDPLCVVEQNLEGKRQKLEGDWMEIGRTEAVMNNLDPKWCTKIHLEFRPQMRQELRFSCYDIDCDKEALTFHDFLGRCQCELDDILKAPNGTHKLRLKKDTGAFAKGELFVHAERANLGNGNEGKESPMVHFQIRGLLSSLAQKQHNAIARNTGGTKVLKPTPPAAYLEFYRIDDENEGKNEDLLMVHRTEKVKNCWYPIWANFEVPLRLLSFGDAKRKFLIHCIDKEANESNKLVGTIRISVDELTNENQWRIELIEPTNGTKKRDIHKKQGHLHFIDVKVD